MSRVKLGAKFVALLAAMTLLLTACGGGNSNSESNKSMDSKEQGASAAANANGTITAAVAYQTKNFDPIGSSSALALGANWHVMEGLYELDMSTFKPFEALAKGEPTKVSDTVYDVMLRDDAKFSDGTPVTIDDVVNSAKLSMDNDLYKGFLNFIDKVEKKDDKTVEFTLKFPFSLLENRLSLIKIVKADQSKDDRTKMPIGTGPWMYKDINEKEVSFVPNPNYNGKFPAKAANMKWQVIKDDVARTTAMQGGTINAMESVPFDSAKTIEAAGAKVEAVQGFNQAFLMFNTKRAPFDKKETRQAFFYAIDAEKLVANAMHGEAKVVTSFLPETFANYHKAKNVYTHDVAKAKDLLKAGGAEGLSVKLLTTDHPWITALAPQIKQDLESAGMKVEVQSLATAALYSQYAATSDFDVVLAPGDPSVFGNDPDLLMNWWYGPGVWTDSRTGWASHPEFKTLHEYMDKAARATGDEQQEEWNKCFDLLSEEVPLYPLFHRKVVTGYYPDKLVDYKPVGTTGLNFIGAGAK